ncbi:hypothetical protein BGZ57DRAFT_565558 [Hyaloscypha finlandica]|nr:hypothetical protein BGZ57DRAFT_565558 [Hyaloscypha finlandica]
MVRLTLIFLQLLTRTRRITALIMSKRSRWGAYMSAKANATTCLELIQKSRALAGIYNPGNMGINATVNSVCSAAYGWCYSTSKLRTWLRARCVRRRPHNPDPTYIGVVVRQFDNLSFSLVFDAAYGALPHLLSFASCG